jgi:CRP-like cAMP-binding protein
MKDTLRSHLELSDAHYEALLHIASRKQAAKETLLFRPGTANVKLLFLETGMMRAYRVKEGNEYTHYFFPENWFATDFHSYLTEQPSELYIAALTDITYYEFKKQELLDLFSRHPSLEKLGRIIAEQAYLKTAERLVDFQTNKLKERYLRLIRTNPQLFQHVPQKYIASYLGVAEQSLSRIKAEEDLLS